MRDILYFDEKGFVRQHIRSVVSIYIRTCVSMFNTFLEETIEMLESKTLVAVLVGIGIPAGIITWFTDFNTVFADIPAWVEPTKTIVLAAITIGGGLLFLIRSGIKTIYSIWELIDKTKARYKRLNKK